jgi:hypothetical protein
LIIDAVAYQLRIGHLRLHSRDDEAQRYAVPCICPAAGLKWPYPYRST